MYKPNIIIIIILSMIILAFSIFYFAIYAGHPTNLIDVYNNDNTTYNLSISINGESTSYTLLPEGSIHIEKESNEMETYNVEFSIDDKLVNRDTWVIGRYDTIFCTINNGVFDSGIVCV